MRAYELALVLRPDLTDEGVDEYVQKVASFIEERGGVPATPTRWGKRRLAYPIDRLNEAIYVFVEFTAAPEVPGQVERMLRLSPEVVRHMVVKAIPKPETEAEEDTPDEEEQPEPVLVQEKEGKDA